MIPQDDPRTGGGGRTEQPGSSSRLCVLVVEDHPKIALYLRQEIQRVFDPQEISVLLAASAPAALSLLEAFSVDAVVCDYDLGDSHGGQVLAFVRERMPHLTSKFVFHSGSEEPYLLHDRVVEKGLRAAELRRQLRDYLADLLDSIRRTGLTSAPLTPLRRPAPGSRSRRPQ